MGYDSTARLPIAGGPGITGANMLDALEHVLDRPSGSWVPPRGASSASDLRDWMARVGVFPQDYGTIGAGDDSGAVNAAMAKLSAVGGGKLWLPPAPFTGGAAPPGSYVSANAWQWKAGVHIQGLSRQIVASWPGTMGDCIQANGSGGQLANMELRDLYIMCSGQRTSGIAIKLQNVAETKIANLVLDGAFSGIWAEAVNTVYVDHTNINNITGPWGINYNADATTSARSDIFKLHEVTVQCFLQGGDGIIWDGAAYGLAADRVYLLGCHIGLHVLNTAQSTSLYPQYGEFRRLETDRASYESVRIEAGFKLDFLGCELSNTSGGTSTSPTGVTRTVSADANCVDVLPDTGFSNTSHIRFIGGTVGNCRQSGLNIQGRHVSVLRTMVGDVSKAGSGQFDAIAVAGGSSDVSLVDVPADPLSARARYALSIAAGVSRSSAKLCQWAGTQVADISNLSASDASNSFTGNLGSNGQWT